MVMTLIENLKSSKLHFSLINDLKVNLKSLLEIQLFKIENKMANLSKLSTKEKIDLIKRLPSHLFDVEKILKSSECNKVEIGDDLFEKSTDRSFSASEGNTPLGSPNMSVIGGFDHMSGINQFKFRQFYEEDTIVEKIYFPNCRIGDLKLNIKKVSTKLRQNISHVSFALLHFSFDAASLSRFENDISSITGLDAEKSENIKNALINLSAINRSTSLSCLAKEVQVKVQIPNKSLYFVNERRNGESVNDDTFFIKIQPVRIGRQRQIKKVKEIIKSFIHPNLIRLYEFGFNENLMWEIYEAGSQGDYYDIRDKNEKFLTSPDEIRVFAIKILKGLKYIHEKGLVHLDIKPENVVFNSLNEPKIIDFDFMSLVNWNGPKIGTFEFMDPDFFGKNLVEYSFKKVN
jgi:serine/threonine protein kinase